MHWPSPYIPVYQDLMDHGWIDCFAFSIIIFLFFSPLWFHWWIRQEQTGGTVAPTWEKCVQLSLSPYVSEWIPTFLFLSPTHSVKWQRGKSVELLTHFQLRRSETWRTTRVPGLSVFCYRKFRANPVTVLWSIWSTWILCDQSEQVLLMKVSPLRSDNTVVLFPISPVVTLICSEQVRVTNSHVFLRCSVMISCFVDVREQCVRVSVCVLTWEKPNVCVTFLEQQWFTDAQPTLCLPQWASSDSHDSHPAHDSNAHRWTGFNWLVLVLFLMSISTGLLSTQPISVESIIAGLVSIPLKRWEERNL